MMKKDVISLLFGIFFLIFLLSGILAVEQGECSITPRSDCQNNIQTGYIVMGLSNYTNAHGQGIIHSGADYPYVLCCNFPSLNLSIDHNTTCKSDYSNRIIRLTSDTNAHAQAPSQSTYLIPVCYQDFVCTGTSTSCPVDKPLGILSLSSTTNAHISPFNGTGSFNATRICCGGVSVSASACRITQAKWSVNEKEEGNKVYLQVTGSGNECNGQRVSFQIYEEGGLAADTPADISPNDVAFNGNSATAVWTTERDSGTPEYYFNASLSKNPKIFMLSATPDLKVKAKSAQTLSITTCSGYTNANDCTNDSLAVAYASTNSNEINCDLTHACSCAWNSGTSQCEFIYLPLTDPGNSTDGCNLGYTLCENATGIYCNLGTTCPTNEKPSYDNDGQCEDLEGCVSPDCIDGDQDNCAAGLYCQADKCSTQTLSLFISESDEGSCIISQTIIKDCNEDPVGYRNVRWNGTWTGVPSGEDYQECVAGGEDIIACPAQVQLPFFDYLELILTVIVIILIYVSITLKRKFRHGIDKIKRRK